MNDEMGNPAEIGEPGGWSHSSAFLVPYGKYFEPFGSFYAMQRKLSPAGAGVLRLDAP